MVAFQNPGTRGCRRTAHHEHVLDADGDACQRTEWIALRRSSIDFRSLLECAFLGKAEEYVEPRIHLLDARVVPVGEIRGPRAPGCNAFAQLSEGLRLFRVGLSCHGFAWQRCVLLCSLSFNHLRHLEEDLVGLRSFRHYFDTIERRHERILAQ